MEVVLCKHGKPCILKTGLKPGPFLNKSMYLCAMTRDNCGFIKHTDLKPMKCPVHKAVVAVQMLDKKQTDFNFFCGSREGSKFCGRMRHPENKENKPNTMSKDFSSCLLSQEKKNSSLITPFPRKPLDKSSSSENSSISHTKKSPNLTSSFNKTSSIGSGSPSSPISSPSDPEVGAEGPGLEMSSNDEECCIVKKDDCGPCNESRTSGHVETKSSSSHNVSLTSHGEGPGSEMCSSDEECTTKENDCRPCNESRASDHVETKSSSSHNVSLASTQSTDKKSPLQTSTWHNKPDEDSESTEDEDNSQNEVSDQDEETDGSVSAIEINEHMEEMVSDHKNSCTSITSPVKSDSGSDRTISVDERRSATVDPGRETRPPTIDLVGNDTKQFKVAHQTKTVMRQYAEIERLLQTQAAHLPDGGAQLKSQKAQLLKRLNHLKAAPPKVLSTEEVGSLLKQRNLLAQNRMLTTGAIVHLHNSLENCPTEDTLADELPGLSVSLMTHQRRALAWMEWRETQTPAAGILADEMGLGKTLSMLSLILKKRGNPEEIQAWIQAPSPKPGLVRCPATLVVCPASLLHQWEEEANSKIRDRFSIYVYHGKKATTCRPYDLVHYDMVVTSFTMVGNEGNACPSDEPEASAPTRKKRMVSHTALFEIHWRRVVLDEAHNIKNPKAAMSMGACKLSADYRWAITGTPIQNTLKDFYSLIKFIHLAPFDDYRIWKDTVEKKKLLGMQRLNTMVSSLVLRRTKADLESSELSLTKKQVTRHNITLSTDEMDIHRYIYCEARKVMYSWLMEKGEDVRINPHDEPDAAEVVTLKPTVEPIINNLMRGAVTAKGKGSCVLWLLLRLRQSCCHMKLLTSGLDSSIPESNNDVDLDLMMDALSLNAPPPVDINLDDLPDIFNQETQSTKVAEVVNEIKRITALPDDLPQKCVVVSQWTKMLDIVDYQLAIAGVSCTRIDGTVTPAERLYRVKQLNSARRNPSVMLLSLQAGGVGLNLIGANHLFILDMHWNPALEQQAADRCHRVGQKRDVFIHKFVCTGTVEERILKLQEQKLQLADNVMTGASTKSRSSASKLSLSDLKNLFELD